MSKITISKAPVLNLALEQDRVQYAAELTWDEHIGDSRARTKAMCLLSQVTPGGINVVIRELAALTPASTLDGSVIENLSALATLLYHQGFWGGLEMGEWRELGIPSKAGWHILNYYSQHPSRPTAKMNVVYLGQGGLATFNAILLGQGQPEPVEQVQLFGEELMTLPAPSSPRLEALHTLAQAHGELELFYRVALSN